MKMKMENSSGKSVFSGACGCMLALLAFNLLFGGVAFDYVLGFVFGEDIHFVGDMLCGLFLGELAVPAAIICLILSLFGIDAPLVG